jgi:opacity protein-like surface antigen
VALQGVYNMTFGDFDDTVLLWDPNTGEVIDVPELDDGYGFGVALGVAGEGFTMELAYQRTMHDTTSILLGDSKATFNSIDLNFKVDLLKRPLRPYIQFGLGVPWLTIDDAVISHAGYKDATFVGLGLGVGGGVSYSITRHLVAGAGVAYRYNWIFNVEGTALEDKLSLHTVSGTVGLSYIF